MEETAQRRTYARDSRSRTARKTNRTAEVTHRMTNRESTAPAANRVGSNASASVVGGKSGKSPSAAQTTADPTSIVSAAADASPPQRSDERVPNAASATAARASAASPASIGEEVCGAANAPVQDADMGGAAQTARKKSVSTSPAANCPVTTSACVTGAERTDSSRLSPRPPAKRPIVANAAQNGTMRISLAQSVCAAVAPPAGSSTNRTPEAHESAAAANHNDRDLSATSSSLRQMAEVGDVMANLWFVAVRRLGTGNVYGEIAAAESKIAESGRISASGATTGTL